MNGNIDKFENEERKRKHNWFYIVLNARYGHSAFRHYNRSELEGLGFNLCVAPPHVVVSLISEDRDGVGGRCRGTVTPMTQFGDQCTYISGEVPCLLLKENVKSLSS